MKKQIPALPSRILRRLTKFFLGLIILSWIPVLILRWVDPPVTAFMLLQSDQNRLYQWQDWSELGITAGYAVMAAEDQKFVSHRGFDVASIQAAVKDHQAGKTLRGASTISQQTAKNLFLWPSRSFVRKGLEAYFTVLVEITWPKQRIMEIYLNIIELGPGVYGIPAASQLYFQKQSSELSIYQAALLAAVLPNPKRLHVQNPSDYVLERQLWIVGQMYEMERAGLNTIGH